MTAATAKCPKCKAKIGRYVGPIGPHLKIESKNFTFADGTHPQTGSSSKYVCPCGHTSDIIATLRAVARGKYTVPAQEGQTREK